MVLAALHQRDWSVSDLADAGEVQAPLLVDWLETDTPAPEWVKVLVRNQLSLNLDPKAAIAVPVSSEPVTPPLPLTKEQLTFVQMLETLLMAKGWDTLRFRKQTGRSLEAMGEEEAQRWLTLLLGLED